MGQTSPPKPPSERSFGFLFTGISAALAIYAFWQGKDIADIWFVLTVAIGLLTLLAPQSLRPLNKAWFHLGLILGKIVSPVVLGIMFFVILTPVALIAKFIGRNELRLKRQNLTSYWIDRIPPGPEPNSFKNQF